MTQSLQRRAEVESMKGDFAETKRFLTDDKEVTAVGGASEGQAQWRYSLANSTYIFASQHFGSGLRGRVSVKSHNPPELTSLVESCRDLQAMKGGSRMIGLDKEPRNDGKDKIETIRSSKLRILHSICRGSRSTRDSCCRGSGSPKTEKQHACV